MPSPEGAPDAPRRHRRARARRLLQSLLSPSKFALVGISGIFVNQAALFAFTEYFGIYYVLSSILASQVSTLTNFVLTELWVFRGREMRGRALVRFVIFDLLNVATLVVRVPVLYLLTELGNIHYLISNLVAIGLTFGIRYAVADNWIWAGRDRRSQRATRGYYQYDIHGLVRVRSTVHLPELAAFNVPHEVEPDLIVRRAWIGGGPRLHTRTDVVDGVVRYREHLGLLGAAFDVTPAHNGKPVRILANWLLVWSRHVLYTNMVEPVLRFMLVERGHVLLHCAAVDGEHGAIVMSAQTDTGKTSTVLRLLMHGTYGFISDDMAIVSPEGEILSYAKPMTLSSHTMSAVNEQRLPLMDRVMLAIRSRVHSKEGRSVGHALGRLNLPIVTINAWVQLLIPPPKYHVTSLVDCDLTDRAPIDSVVLMERGAASLAEEPELEPTIDELLENTDDAYTFPPFATVAPHLSFGGLDYAALRVRERELLTAAVS
ncbi:MAG TPA: GtrA family protein, partial [Candidatus Limnocylindrales bacterium]|nr:GtrA family protein [Candidatus Limnocylindrales bacterium]